MHCTEAEQSSNGCWVSVMDERLLRNMLRVAESSERKKDTVHSAGRGHYCPRRPTECAQGMGMFDTVLYTGEVNLAGPELKRQLTAYQLQCFSRGEAPSGRYALWHLLQRSSVTRATAAQADFTMLLRHNAYGDLELYLDGLDIILEQLDEPPSDALLYSLLEPQLRGFKALDHIST